jgi:heme ABC exporter ATP-binding subunit CcmA
MSLAGRVDFERVETDNVSRQFGRRRALSKVSVQAAAGDVLVLLGPNGAGKSTLLNVLSSLMRPTSGVVRYGHHTASGTGDALRARIGFLGHELFLYTDLSARENLEFAAKLYRLDRVSERVAQALERARLIDRAQDRVGEFSRGMRQRLALERALLHAPRLVLLDEPYTGLDEASAGHLSIRLRELAAGGAIVWTAVHDFDRAAEIATRTMVLDRGRVVEIPAGQAPLIVRYRAALEAAAAASAAATSTGSRGGA